MTRRELETPTIMPVVTPRKRMPQKVQSQTAQSERFTRQSSGTWLTCLMIDLNARSTMAASVELGRQRSDGARNSSTSTMTPT